MTSTVWTPQGRVWLIKCLETATSAKQEGNSHYKEGNYDLALDSYSEAILYCPLDNTQELVGVVALTCTCTCAVLVVFYWQILFPPIGCVLW